MRFSVFVAKLITPDTYSLTYSVPDDLKSLDKHSWLVILHASRIPPHVGLMINGNYNSLTIKERELNVSSEALLKTINRKNIDALFLRLAKHPVFSEDYKLQVFQEQLKQFTSVKPGEATCLSPIKLFFEEFYAIKKNDDLLYDFVDSLYANAYVSEAIGMNIKDNGDKNVFTFTTYTESELQERIKKERESFFKS